MAYFRALEVEEMFVKNDPKFPAECARTITASQVDEAKAVLSEIRIKHAKENVMTPTEQLHFMSKHVHLTQTNGSSHKE